MFRSSPLRDASPFRSSPPLVEEDASAPRYEENAAPPAELPSLEELWKEMDVALWEALPPAERAKIEAEKKAEEEKRTAEQAAWEAYVASERVRQLALWQKARARAVRVAEDARAGPECSRAQAPHLCLAVHGPGARFQRGGVPVGAGSPHR